MKTLEGLNKTLMNLNVESGTAVEIADKYFNFKYFCVSVGWASFVIVGVVVSLVAYRIGKPLVTKILKDCTFR